jgi:hypothetical protein
VSTNRIYSNKLVFLHRSGYLMVAAYCWPCRIELNTHFAGQRGLTHGHQVVAVRTASAHAWRAGANRESLLSARLPRRQKAEPARTPRRAGTR